MEQETEEITRVATREEVNERLEMLTKVHVFDDQANYDYRCIAANKDSTRDEITAALYHRQETEAQYVRLSKWLWANTPNGIRYDHDAKKYVLR